METNGISRRGFVGLGAAGALLALAGCAPTTASKSTAGATAKAGGKVTGDLSLGQWGTAQRAQLYNQAIGGFTTANPGANVTLEWADLNPYVAKLLTQAAAGDLPDVLWMRDTSIKRYGSSGTLLDLTKYLGNGINTSSLGKEPIADGHINGGHYGITTHYVGQALLANDDALSSAGIKLDDIKTWDDLADAGKQLTKPSEGFYGITDPTMGTAGQANFRFLEAWIRQAGEELFTEQGQLGCKEDTLVSFYEYWNKLRSAGVIPPAATEQDADQGGLATNLMVVGKAGIFPSASNYITQTPALTKLPIVMSSAPAAKDADKDWWFFPPVILSIATNTKNAEASVALFDFFLNDVPAAKITQLQLGAPTSTKIRAGIRPVLPKEGVWYVDQITREQKYPARPLPLRPNAADQVNTLLTTLGQNIAYGKESTTSAVKSFMQDAKLALVQNA